MRTLFKHGSILLILPIILSLTGCSPKTLYNKPSVFFSAKVPSGIDEPIDKTKDNSKLPAKTSKQDSSIKLYCLNKSGEILPTENNITIFDGSRLDRYGNCTGYYTLDMDGQFERQEPEANASHVRWLARQLLVLSNKNCTTFTNSFYMNDAVLEGGLSVIDINVFGLAGINLGKMKEYTTSQLVAMSNNLTLNLEKRKTFRTKIISRLNSKNDYKLFEMIGDITAYDNLCSVLNTSGIATDDISVASFGTFMLNCPTDMQGHAATYTLLRDGDEYYQKQNDNSSYTKIDGYILHDNNISIDLITGDVKNITTKKYVGKCTMPTNWLSPFAK